MSTSVFDGTEIVRVLAGHHITVAAMAAVKLAREGQDWCRRKATLYGHCSYEGHQRISADIEPTYQRQCTNTRSNKRSAGGAIDAVRNASQTIVGERFTCVWLSGYWAFSTSGICISGCEVHRRGSTYFAAFLATELESTSDASPEPEEPADDTHHSNINRTKAEDRVDDVIVVLSNVETVEEVDAIVAEEGGILALVEVIEDSVAVAEGSLIEVNEEIITAAVSPLFNKFTEVKVSRSQGILLDEGYDREGSFKELQNTTTDFAEAIHFSETELIDKTQSRVVDLIMSTLRLSNLDIVASYVFRGGNKASMPADKSVKLGSLGDRKDGLREVVQDFSAAAASKLFEQEIRELMS
ncbi:hypothetical protein Tco_1466126 [Tanacetum coccineum]